MPCLVVKTDQVEGSTTGLIDVPPVRLFIPLPVQAVLEATVDNVSPSSYSPTRDKFDGESYIAR